MPARRDPGTKPRTRLAAARMSRGVTQAELAAAVGISAPTYRRLEHGETLNPKLRHLTNCAIALGVDLADVLEDAWLEWLPLSSAASEPPVRDEFWRRPYRPAK